MNDLKTLNSLFNEYIFRIPDYQRGYAWGKVQLEDFWDDINNLPSNKKHYTGMISLQEFNEKEIEKLNDEEWAIEKYKPFYIVDGQQRITTFIIFLKAIIDNVRNLNKNKDKEDRDIVLGIHLLDEIVKKFLYETNPSFRDQKIYKFGYINGDKTNDFFKKEIMGEKILTSIENSIYTNNLVNAYNFFKSKLDYLHNTNSDEKFENILISLYDKLTNKLLFVVQEIKDDFDINVAFETMNNRGLSLSNLEKLKNRLIYLINLYPSNELSSSTYNLIRKNINTSWKNIYKQLGRKSREYIVDDDFLKNHWFLYYGYSRAKGHDYETEILKNIFVYKNVISDSNSNNHLTPEDINNYVKDLSITSEYWYYSYNPNENSNLTEEEKNWINRLNRLGISYFRPLIVASYMNESITINERLNLLKQIERFIFLLFRCKTGFNAQYCESEFLKKAKLLRLNKINIESIVIDLTEKVDYAVNQPNGNMNSFKERIDKYFINGEGFYSWDSLKYFLYEYETNLIDLNSSAKIDPDKYFIVGSKDLFSVEHIFPQTSSTVYYWANKYRFFNVNQKFILCNSLGNLLPLSKNVNSTLQNYEYIKKKNGRPNHRGYKLGSYSEVEVFNHDNCSNDWTAFDILNRGLTLLDFFEQRWNVSLGSKEEKIELLHLNFLNSVSYDVPELKIFDDKYTVIKQKGARELKRQFGIELINSLKQHNFNVPNYEIFESSYQWWFNINDEFKEKLYFDLRDMSLYFYTENLELFEKLKEQKQDIDLNFEFDTKWDVTQAVYYRKIKIKAFNNCDYKNRTKWNAIIPTLARFINKAVIYLNDLLLPLKYLNTEYKSPNYSENEFLDFHKSVSENTLNLYNNLKKIMIEKYQRASLYFRKNYAGFKEKQLFAEVHLMQDGLKIFIKDYNYNSKLGVRADDSFGWALNYQLYVKSLSDFEEALNLIDLSHSHII